MLVVERKLCRSITSGSRLGNAAMTGSCISAPSISSRLSGAGEFGVVLSGGLLLRRPTAGADACSRANFVDSARMAVGILFGQVQ
jgi:hypothetical protein